MKLTKFEEFRDLTVSMLNHNSSKIDEIDHLAQSNLAKMKLEVFEVIKQSEKKIKKHFKDQVSVLTKDIQPSIQEKLIGHSGAYSRDELTKMIMLKADS